MVRFITMEIAFILLLTKVETIWFLLWCAPGSLDNHNTVVVNFTTTTLYCDWPNCLAGATKW